MRSAVGLCGLRHRGVLRGTEARAGSPPCVHASTPDTPLVCLPCTPQPNHAHATAAAAARAGPVAGPCARRGWRCAVHMCRSGLRLCFVRRSPLLCGRACMPPAAARLVTTSAVRAATLARCACAWRNADVTVCNGRCSDQLLQALCGRRLCDGAGAAAAAVSGRHRAASARDSHARGGRGRHDRIRAAAAAAHRVGAPADFLVPLLRVAALMRPHCCVCSRPRRKPRCTGCNR